MVELSGYAFSVLQEAEFTLIRGQQDGFDPLLVAVPVEDDATVESVERLKHEYMLRAELDPRWAAQPIALTQYRDRPALAMRDPGGEPLDRLLGHPLNVLQFLGIAIPFAAACGQMHERGLIHRNIKPANMLVDAVDGRVWLTGFGIASRLPREHQAPEPPDVIAGTLAYLAPEQTGRMNRSIDSRSDLYAMGVSFYQMLTGALPFVAASPMEWVHCHIARRPSPPRERTPTVPEQISSLVMRLLAKMPEDRYQSAAGVEADLRRCLAEWQATGAMTQFSLGDHDVPDRLMIPEKLYGRERDVERLLSAFDRVVANGQPRLVLVSGYSGIGKSTVVNELHGALVPSRGLFAAGKFDQYKRDIPYATLAQAFEGLIRMILGRNEAELACWREAIQQALGPNGQLIVNLIPELERVIGPQPSLADVSPLDAQNRFQTALRRFVGVFARPEHPLALFLDDLQWLDGASLDLVHHLLAHQEVRHLMLVGAYRDNEVGATHPLTHKLQAIRNAGVTIDEIALAPLARQHIGALVADALRCETERVAPLAQLVHEKTAGNPFFTIQFIHSLADDGSLRIDPDTRRWSWNIDRIDDKGYTDNVVDLMLGALSRLPAQTKTALQRLACLGNVAETAILFRVLGIAEEQMHTALGPAVRRELLERRNGAYAFIHDRAREAAYSLIPEASRAAAHLQIGRLLAAQTPPWKREAAIFEIVNQLNRGAALISSPVEREELAELNLIAGQRAKTTAAYASALTYLTAGADLLSEESWALSHDLAFALELHRAECEFITGDLAGAERRLAALSGRAANTVERASVACLRADLYTTLDESGRAIAVGLDFLRHLGVDWPPHPTQAEARREYDHIWLQLGSRAIEDLIELPVMSDAASLATVDVLGKVAAAAYHTDAHLPVLAACRAVSLSLERGNCDASCYNYVIFGRVAGTLFGDHVAGFRFGQLGFDLVEQRGLKRFEARTYHCFANFVLPWMKHVRAAFDPQRRALAAADRDGDVLYGAAARNHLNADLLFAGEPLPEAQGEAEEGLAFGEKAQHGLTIVAITTQLALIRMLRGLTPKFGCLEDGQFSEPGIETQLAGNAALAVVECWYWIRKLQARYIAGDYAAAVECAAKAQPLLWTSYSFLEEAEYHFFGALAQAAWRQTAAIGERGPHLSALAAHHKQLQIWAERCPENFENRAVLVGAEIARGEGRDLDAMRLYEQAIRSARDNGFVHNEAIANELAGRFYEARDFGTIAEVYLRRARSCYLRWGADGKVRQLDQLHPGLRPKPPSPYAEATIGASVERLELTTVVKVSEAIAGEMNVEKLIETVMALALQHAGAERGLFLRPHGDDLWIEAEAVMDRDAVVVALRRAPAAVAELPQTILRYVSRVQDSLLLDDASEENPFSGDEYVGRTHARSLLCVPLMKEARLVGVLYLENNQASRIFTPARLAVLKLLASLAAISLENARLYAELGQENRERRAAEDELRSKEASLSAGQRISQTGSWRWNAQAGELSWSAELYRIYGRDAAKPPPSLGMIVEAVHPEDQNTFREAMSRTSAGHPIDIEHRIIAPNGVTKIVRTVGRPDDVAGSGDFVGIVMDVTERRMIEEALRASQAQLARVSHLTAVGEIAASIVHEINQPLAGIVANADAGLLWLGREEPQISEVQAVLERIVAEGTRAADIVRSLRALARKSNPDFSDVDVNAAILEILEIMRGELQKSGIVLIVDLAHGDCRIRGDSRQLQQVFLNLIRNAAESMEGVSDRQRELIVRTSVSAEGLITIAVGDVGVGIATESAGRIFEPLYTTKPTGMGMGLAICKSIVEAHGSQLRAKNGEPNGSVFSFSAPRLGYGDLSLSRQAGLTSPALVPERRARSKSGRS